MGSYLHRATRGAGCVVLEELPSASAQRRTTARSVGYREGVEACEDGKMTARWLQSSGRGTMMRRRRCSVRCGTAATPPGRSPAPPLATQAHPANQRAALCAIKAKLCTICIGLAAH